MWANLINYGVIQRAEMTAWPSFSCVLVFIIVIIFTTATNTTTTIITFIINIYFIFVISLVIFFIIIINAIASYTANEDVARLWYGSEHFSKWRKRLHMMFQYGQWLLSKGMDRAMDKGDHFFLKTI